MIYLDVQWVSRGLVIGPWLSVTVAPADQGARKDHLGLHEEARLMKAGWS